MAQTAKVIKFPKKSRRKGPQEEEDIFFTKGQIRVGVRLEYFGRLDPHSLWVVDRIVTVVWSDRQGQYLPKRVDTASKLADSVYFKNIRTGEERLATFGYLSYSAIWRIASTATSKYR